MFFPQLKQVSYCSHHHILDYEMFWLAFGTRQLFQALCELQTPYLCFYFDSFFGFHCFIFKHVSTKIQINTQRLSSAYLWNSLYLPHFFILSICPVNTINFYLPKISAQWQLSSFCVHFPRLYPVNFLFIL